MAPLQAVVIGVGHMGGLHARKLEARPDVAVRLIDPARGLDGPVGRPDFAIIAVPTSLHRRVAVPLLEAGIPCLVEKPLAASEADAAQLAAFPHCFPGHIVRFSPEFRAFDEHRDRTAVTGFVQTERLAAPTGRSADVDVVMDLMIHDLDLALYLFGQPVVEVRAIGVALGADTARVDIANARLETASGQVANLTASRVSRRPVRSLRVFSGNEYWSLDAMHGRLERVPWGRPAGAAMALSPSPSDALDAEHDAILAHVRGQAPYPIPAVQGLAAVQLALQVVEGIANNRSRSLRARGA